MSFIFTVIESNVFESFPSSIVIALIIGMNILLSSLFPLSFSIPTILNVFPAIVICLLDCKFVNVEFATLPPITTEFTSPCVKYLPEVSSVVVIYFQTDVSTPCIDNFA